MTDDRSRVRRGRVQFLLLAALFIGPLAVAWLLYFGDSGWKPQGSTNHGILVEPPVPLPEMRIAARDPEGPERELRGQWTMLYLDGGECAERCLEALDLSARIRIALGRRMTRVQRAYVAEGPGLAGDLPDSQADLLVVEGPGLASVAPLLAALPPDLPRDGSEILLVDPLGNLMMRFPVEGDPKGMLQDIKKLLRVSRIG